MKPAHLSALLPSILALAGPLQGATSFWDSVNTEVDTRANLPAITVTMHRAEANVIENKVPTTGIDEPLRVKGSALGALSPQSILQGDVVPTNDPGFQVFDPKGGLVADGVTPLLFEISAPGNSLPAAGTTYELSLKSVGRGRYFGSLNDLLEIVKDGILQPELTCRLTPSQPTAYAVFGPVDTGKLKTTYLLAYKHEPVVADLEVREAGRTKRVAVFRFGIRKPPVALVHGYNVKRAGWGLAYTSALADRGDFLLPVGYGLADDHNTTDDLSKLATTLDQELRMQIEEAPSLRNWAFTRYDAVGHSQGGVLLRMLCSQNASSAGFLPFRNDINLQRGRFRRVVTIGSPHAGSAIAEMGIQLRKRKIPFGGGPIEGPAVNTLDYFRDLDRLLQAKFRIGSGTALGEINDTLQCDPFARLHLLRTTIYGGFAPGANGVNANPHYYQALYLNLQTPTVNGQRPGLVVAPSGSDGVVDVDNQEAGPGANHTSAITGENIIHADIPILLDEIPDTESSTVAKKVTTLLDGAGSEFGPVTIPTTLKVEMSLRAANISLLAQAIQEGQDNVQTACFAPVAPIPPVNAAPEPGAPPVAEAPGDETFSFALQPPAGESPNGPVEWSALAYGPGGVSGQGLSLATSGAHGEKLELTLAASVQGQVILAVRFPSSSGKTVIGTPQVAIERLPGEVLSGIVLTPAVIQLQAGTELPLTVSGIWDGSVPSSLFTNPPNTSFQTSNAAVATVDADGRVSLAGLGTATITAIYKGTLTATAAVTVLDEPPIVTSAAIVSGAVGQTLTYQITASQAVQDFGAAPLPSSLTVDTETGMIHGTPTTQGATSALVSVTNANGAGSKLVNFVITGPPGTPTDLGIDAAGVNGGKPAGTLVGRLVTIDPNPLDTFAYELVDGTGSTNNAAFSITGDQLSTAAVLDGATTSTVSIRVRTTDSSGASFEKALVLPVGAPPVVTRQPDPRDVFVGDRAAFVVETTGIEPLQYQWKKDGVDVAGATNRVLEVPTSAFADAGSYTVTVTNGDGTVTSAPASLIVNPISYGKWASLIPAETSGMDFEPMDDYNGDGVVNFLEFAFGVQPSLGSAVEALPFMMRDAGGVVLTYREANSIEPLGYLILKSPDLLAWAEHQPAVGDVTRIDGGSYTEVQVRITPPNEQMFFKLSVEIK